MKARGSRYLLAAVFLSASTFVHGQNYPVRPVRVLVGLAAGASTDIAARIVAQGLAEKWKQSVIIDNRGGSGGVLASELVAKAPPDGYTLQFVAPSFTINASVIHNLPFDTVRDFEPIAKLGFRENALVVSSACPANSLKELIALAKAKPGQLSFGSGGGTGSSDHLIGEMFKLMAHVDIVHVPYKSGPQVLTDVINGQITMFLGGLAASLPMIKAGKIKALATTGAKRSSVVPDVPTYIEAGLPGFQPQVWYGLVAPRGTPKNIIAKIAADSTAVVNSPEIRERFAAIGNEPAKSTPDEFRVFLKSEIDGWAKVVKAAGL